uniref:Uncharacterized protein n=1 Tax=Branchiostoma floridae TaxID=7739 RepID=C3ZJR8_BRAFL|eukprot:XP_002591192.1 hypothetical protein BRAFLDRAFT_105394 [Branchiostoma floridae]
MAAYIEHHTYLEHRTLKKVGVIVKRINCKGEVVDTRQEYNIDYVKRHNYAQSRWVRVLDKLRTRSFSVQLRNSIEDLKRSDVRNVSLHHLVDDPNDMINLDNIPLAYALLDLGCGLNCTTLREVTLPQVIGFEVATKPPPPSVRYRCQTAMKQLSLRFHQSSSFVFPGIEPVYPNCRMLVEVTGGIDMINRAFINWVWDDEAHTRLLKDRCYPSPDLLRFWMNNQCLGNQGSLLPLLLYSMMTKETDIFQVLNPTTFVANWSPLRPGPFVRLTSLCDETDKIVWFARHITIVKRKGAPAPIFRSHLDLPVFPPIMAQFWERLTTHPIDVDIPRPMLTKEATQEERWICWHEAFMALWEAIMPDLPIYEGPNHEPTYRRLAWPNEGNGKIPQLYCGLPHRTDSITETAHFSKALLDSTPRQYVVVDLPTEHCQDINMRNYLRGTLYPVKDEYLPILNDTMNTAREFYELIKHLETTYGLKCSATGDKGQFLNHLVSADNTELGEAIRRYVSSTCHHLTLEDLKLTTPKKSLIRSVAFSMASKYRQYKVGEPVGCYAKPISEEEIGITDEDVTTPDFAVTYIRVTGLADSNPTYWFLVNDQIWQTHVANEFATIKLNQTGVSAELTMFEPRRKYKPSEKQEYRRTHPEDSKGPRARLPPADRVCGTKIWLKNLAPRDLEKVSQHLSQALKPCCLFHSGGETQTPASLTICMCFQHMEPDAKPPSLSYRSIMSILRQQNVVLGRVPIVSTTEEYEMSGRPSPKLISVPKMTVSVYQRRVQRARRLNKEKTEKDKKQRDRLKSMVKAQRDRDLAKQKMKARKLQTKAKRQASKEDKQRNQYQVDE